MKLLNVVQSKQCLLLSIRFQFIKPDIMTEADLDKLREYGAASLRKIIDKKTETQYDIQLLLDIETIVDGLTNLSDTINQYQCNPVIYKMRIVNKPFNHVKLPVSLELHSEDECQC